MQIRVKVRASRKLAWMEKIAYRSSSKEYVCYILFYVVKSLKSRTTSFLRRLGSIQKQKKHLRLSWNCHPLSLICHEEREYKSTLASFAHLSSSPTQLTPRNWLPSTQHSHSQQEFRHCLLLSLCTDPGSRRSWSATVPRNQKEPFGPSFTSSTTI